MANIRKLVFSLGLLLLCATAVWAASATANITPDGWNEGCKFNDDNGMLIDTRGADATWANSVGTLMSCDPNDTKNIYGGPVDCKYFDGAIVGAEQPMWIVSLQAESKVEAVGYRGGNFTRPISCCAKSELTVYGDVRHWAASERQLSDTVTPGYYDIPVLVGLATEHVTDGGHSSDLAVYPSIQTRTDWAIFSHSTSVPAATCEFTYKAYVYTFMEIDFVTMGTECVGVEVDQEGEMPWSGVALAYDGAVQLEQYLLD